MGRCRICGTDLAKDLFAYVAQKPTCCICTASLIGGDFSDARIEKVRMALKLEPGEYLRKEVSLVLGELLLGRMRV